MQELSYQELSYHSLFGVGPDLQYPKRRLVGKLRAQERQRDVVDRHVVGNLSLEAAVMGMTVKHRCQRIAVQRLLEPARPHESINLQRFAFDGRLNGGVMKEGNSVSGAQLGESGFQLEGLFNRLVYELFDELLSPGRQGASAITTRKTFDARKPNPFYLPRLAIQ